MFGSEIRSTSEDVLSALKRHSSISHNQKSFESKFPMTKRGLKWSSKRYINSTSMEESGNSKTSQETWNMKSRNISPPEQKVSIRIV